MWHISEEHKWDGEDSNDMQTLPMLTTIWMNISMNFIVGLPKADKKLVIMVVVDQISKYGHFCAPRHSFTSTIVAQYFLDQIFKLHSMTTSILSN